MPTLQNDNGGKLEHPGLTSDEIFDLVQLAAAAYTPAFVASSYDLSSNWRAVTGDLTDATYGLDPDLIPDSDVYQSSTFPTSGLLDIIFPGQAEAMFLVNDEGDAALAFQGTTPTLSGFGIPFVAGNSGDWSILGQRAHFAAFQPLFDAIDLYLTVNNISQLFVTGHSLGGAMTEFYMEDYADGAVAGVTYEAVAVASPQASFDSDSRALNIGHEADPVYSIAGFRNSNAVSEIYVALDDVVFFPDIREALGQHNSDIAYPHSVKTLLSSQFYDETTRDSRVVINYTDDVDRLREAVDDLFTPDDSALILGRGVNSGETFPNVKGSGVLTEDDHLIGGNGDDFLEAFHGDDTLEGDVGSILFDGGDDTMAGGSGQDLFLGAPEDLNGDTIVDLEVGDRIGTSSASIDEDTIVSTATTVSFNADSGLLDIGGTDVTINAVLPAGASLRLLDETLPDGGSIIEVVGGGQDVAFVIDTTGSMADDIDAVKASATEIIDAIFDSERGLNDSRVAVVGYNDPTTETILSFTNQNDISDRQSAALSAINSISVFGGGDFEELTYTGLLRALDGGAGEWRSDAAARKIVLFGDATAKDTDLRDDVIALAANLGVDLGSSTLSSLSTVDITEDISLTTLNSVSASTALPIPVQIFTVAIGSDSGAIDEFDAIAEDTGGAAFQSADATEIVDTLLEIINLPIYTLSSSTVSVIEGDSGQTLIDITIQRDVSGSPSDVTLSLSGATDSNDASLSSQTVSFATNELSQTVQLVIEGDIEFEDNETAIVSITGVTEPATLGTTSVVVTIEDDDAFIASGPVLLDGGNSNVNIDGQVFEFLDFGGIDTYTILPNLLGDVVITDNNLSGINLPEGLVIEDARFLSDGLQLQVNGNTITFLGNPDDFAYVFGGTPLDPSVGSILRYDQVASAFGTSLPAPGQPATSALFTGAVRIDGTIEGSSSGGPTTISSVSYFLLDQAAELAGDPNRLNNIDIDGLVFGITDQSGATTQVVLESDAANVAGTHQGFVNSLQAPLQALISDGTLPTGTTLRLDPTFVDTTFLADGSQSDPIPAMVLTVNDGSILFGLGFSRIDDPIGIFDVYGRLSDFTETFAQMASVDEPVPNAMHMSHMTADDGDIGLEHELSPFDYATPIEVVGTSIDTIESYA